MDEQGTAGRIVADLVAAGLVDPGRSDDALAVVRHRLPAPLPPGDPADRRTAAPGHVPAAPPGPGPEPARSPARRGAPRVTEMIAYAGAALVVVAIILLGAEYWGDLTAAQRSLILAGIALVLLAGALTLVRVAGGSWTRREDLGLRIRLLAGTLITASAIAAGVSLGSWLLHVLFPPPDYDVQNVSMTAGVGLGLVILLAGYALAPSPLVHLALGWGTVMLLTGLWLGPDREIEALRAVLVLAVGAAWLALALRGRWWDEPGLGAGVGSLLLLFGGQLLLALRDPGWAHAVTFGVAVALFTLYWWRGWWVLLAVGVIALTISVTEALLEWTDGSLGAGGAVLVAGLALLASAGGGLLLRGRRERRARPASAG
ncbi:hypothetical protein E7744_01970 [Citricoccus sp. SGAir0253]|uniref:hypothetical protein n=1 Tax=Citricoccus sp. SGAir0253 TaxID=2567881 RepID=UPI0010CCF495|nr:hypothetical protein [Citricoccus sp. SGAir0253]QCU77125.1 hypothetical protein E7744_01970 [Citricoccus sp. SGAir0253]